MPCCLLRTLTMPRPNGSGTSNVQSMLAHVGNCWSNAILCTLVPAGPLRPSALQKLLHALSPAHLISQRMLTLNLRTLDHTQTQPCRSATGWVRTRACAGMAS